jgi:hypothetical protein
VPIWLLPGGHFGFAFSFERDGILQIDWPFKIECIGTAGTLNLASCDTAARRKYRKRHGWK